MDRFIEMRGFSDHSIPLLAIICSKVLISFVLDESVTDGRTVELVMSGLLHSSAYDVLSLLREALL